MVSYSRAIEFTRYDSGSHFLDSGGAYGRIHQSEAPENGKGAYNQGGYPAISVTQMLVDCFEEDERITRKFNKWARKDKRSGLSWFECTQEYFTRKGYTELARDNTYNNENDLDQNFMFEVWARPGCDVSDWIWANDDEVLIVLFLHTGCDVRGGYSAPLIGNFTLSHSYSMPLDWCVEIDVEVQDESDESDAAEEARSLCESWRDSGELCCGYSGHPLSYLEYDLSVVLGEYDEEQDAYHGKLNGVKVWIRYRRPYWGE